MPTPSPELANALARLQRGLDRVAVMAPNEARVEIVDVAFLVDNFDAVESVIGHKMDCIADVNTPGFCMLRIGEEF